MNKSKKKNHWHYFQEHFSNAKKVWSKVNEILQQNKNKDKLNISWQQTNSILLHQCSMISPKRPWRYILTISFRITFKKSNKHTFLLQETEFQECYNTKRAYCKKATDIYRISPKIIKIAADVLKTIWQYSLVTLSTRASSQTN